MADQPEQGHDPSRRRLLAGLAASTAGASLTSYGSGSPLIPNNDEHASLLVPSGLPNPQDSGIDHIVVVMMENRSFDHYFGWLPGAEGRQAGRKFADVDGKIHDSHDLAPDFQNCLSADPAHGYDSGRIQYNGGRMNGFLKTAPAGDTFPIGYYTRDSLDFFGPASDAWTVCDHYFCGILSSTFPNRMYMHSGQTDRLSNTLDISKLPTIWDRLAAKGLRGEYYYGDLPFTALWGAKYLDISFPHAVFSLRAATGTLPPVSFVDPRMLFEGQGVSNDDHPLADIRNGQAFLNYVYNTLRRSPNWSRTLLVINYDEWGGFADHVPPRLAAVSQAERDLGNDGRMGFRVPCMLIGPHARAGYVAKLHYDPNSILNLMAWRFGLDPLGVRAATSNSLALALNFNGTPRTDAPAFKVSALQHGLLCSIEQLLPGGAATTQVDAASRSRAEHLLELQTLRSMARRYGFAV